MRKTIFCSLLLAVPLAAGAYAPESDTEQDPEIQQGLQEQDTGMQETQGQDAQSQQPQTQDASSQSGQDMQQGQEMSQEGEQQADVARAQFTNEVRDREPVDEVENVAVSEAPVYFFTEVENAEGQTITHRWKREGEVMAEVPLEVGSDKWRTWSSKELTPELEGEWTVEVVDAQGNTITEESVTVERGEQMQEAGYSPDDQGPDDQGQMEQSSQSGEQGEMEQATEQDQQAQDEDWEGVQYEEGAEAQDVEAEDDQATEEEDW